MEGKKCLMMGVTPNLMFAAMNVIIGVEKYSKDLFDKIIIFSPNDNEIIQEDKIAAKEISPKIEFRKFECPYLNTKLNAFIQHYSIMVFCKFFIFELTKEFDSILWMDADMLVSGDISEIFNSKTDIAWRPAAMKMKSQIVYPGISLSDSDTKPNGGLILLNRTAKTEKIGFVDCIEIFSNTIENVTKKDGLEELMMGMVAVVFGLSVEKLSMRWNCVFEASSEPNPIILHAMGKRKFWNDWLLGSIYREWWKNNEVWKEHGGSQYEGEVNGEIRTSLQLVKAVNSLDYWGRVIEHNMFVERGITVGDRTSNAVRLYIYPHNDIIYYELIQKMAHSVYLKKNIDEYKESCVCRLVVNGAEYCNMFYKECNSPELNEYVLDGKPDCIILYKVVKQKELMNEMIKLIDKTQYKMRNYLMCKLA